MSAHSGLPEFTYVRPETLAEASQFLLQHQGQARPFMGGTDCFVRMRDGFFSPAFLVDVKHLDGMREIFFDGQTGLIIGAAAPMNAVAANADVRREYPLLAEAIGTVAGYQLRSRATIAGNICNASPAGDTIGACLAYEGEVKVHSADGFRTEQLAAFFSGPGKTVLQPGDIVTEVRLPVPPAGAIGRYVKLGRNRMSDLATVGVTVLAYPDGSAASGSRFRIVLASVAPVPLRAEQAEHILASSPLTDETISAAAMAAMDAARPIDDVRSTALYRKLMVRNITAGLLTDLRRQLTTAGVS